MQDLSNLKDKNPLEVFKEWLREAEADERVPEAHAMVLSTVYINNANDMTAHSRVILLKEVEKDELIFYTNYWSTKAFQLKYESAINFYWPALGKQVRMEGVTSKVDRQKSEKYWRTRPRESQISQYISKQSEKLDSRRTLEKRRIEVEKEFIGKAIPCPGHWGGYGFTPHLIEFWVEKPHRLHDRMVFKKKFFAVFSKKKWVSHLLYP